MKRFSQLIVAGLSGILLSFGGLLAPAQAATLPQQRVAIKKQIKRDMRHVGGRWSVAVTRLGKRPLRVVTGNQPVRAQRSASTIKVFVMLTVFSRAQHRQLKLKPADKTNLKRMIQLSDNTATNTLIRRVGGFKVVNKTARHYGFKHTHLRRYMLDNRALNRGRDNLTSVSDLTRFLTRIKQRRLLGKRWDAHMLTLLRHCRNHSKLPKFVTHAIVYNKTGELPAKGVQNDASMFTTKWGTYTIVVMAQQGSQARQYAAMNRLGKDVVTYLNRHA